MAITVARGNETETIKGLLVFKKRVFVLAEKLKKLDIVLYQCIISF